jgi:hypothetical protein
MGQHSGCVLVVVQDDRVGLIMLGFFAALQTLPVCRLCVHTQATHITATRVWPADLQGNAAEAMSLYLQLSKLGPAAGTTSSAALAKLARAAAASGDAAAIQVLQKQLPGKGPWLVVLELHAWAACSAPGRTVAVGLV